MESSAPAARLAPVGLDLRRWRALGLSPVLLRESRAALTGRSYDPAGALTITGALVLLVCAVVKAPDAGWGDAATILPLAGSALLLAAFTLIESRYHAPLVPLRILRSRTLAGANAVTVLIGTVAVGMPFVLTLYAQQVLGYSALKFGVSSVVLAAGATAGAIAGQAAVLKAGFRSAAAAGMALMAAGSLALAQVSVRGGYFPDIFFGLRASPSTSPGSPRASATGTEQTRTNPRRPRRAAPDNTNEGEPRWERSS